MADHEERAVFNVSNNTA